MKKYAKGVIAIVTAGLVAAASAFPVYTNEIQTAIAILGAIGVYLYPNEVPEP